LLVDPEVPLLLGRGEEEVPEGGIDGQCCCLVDDEVKVASILAEENGYLNEMYIACVC